MILLLFGKENHPPFEEDQLSNLEPLEKKIMWDLKPSKVNYNAIILEHFIPDIKGRAELDDYLSTLWNA